MVNAEAFVLALGEALGPDLASVSACHRLGGEDLCLSDKEIRNPCHRMSLFVNTPHVIRRRRPLFSEFLNSVRLSSGWRLHSIVSMRELDWYENESYWVTVR
jgi:hypothetical protein